MLSAYALACGAVERYEGPDFYVELWREHNAYHVRAGFRWPGQPRHAWDTFATLRDAQRRFRALRDQLKEQSR